VSEYAYKWVRTHLPYSLDRDDANIRRHLDKGWEEVPLDEMERLPTTLIGTRPIGGGLALYRMAPDAYWWTTLNLVLKANLALEFELSKYPGNLQVTIEREDPAEL
jgi:hypothetical protein